MREFENANIDKILSENIIHLAPTEWTLPIVFALEKGCTLRFCVGYQKLKAVTKRDLYSILRREELIESLGEAKVFFTLEANRGYWQIEIETVDRDKKAFTSHHGLFRFIQISFGMRKPPGNFQRTMDITLSTVKCQFDLVYLDDIVVFA